MLNQPMRVFLDTDIGPDCDDTGALAILLQLCREQKAQLLGVTHCTGSYYGLAAADCICRLFGVQVPMGTCPDHSFLSTGSALRYTPSLAEHFEHGFPPDAPQPDAVDTLVKALSPVPDGSVTLIAVGPLNNLARFLTEPVSAPLMRAKVCRLVLMAGYFEGDKDYLEWNIKMDPAAMCTVAREWKGPIDFCPSEALSDVLTGHCLKNCVENPVSMAYRLFTEGGMLRPSWDLATVASAILGPQEPFVWSAPGRLTVTEEGRTFHQVCEGGNCRYLRRVGSAEEGAAWIEPMLARAVDTMSSRLTER